jgi:hypothetical protein
LLLGGLHTFTVKMEAVCAPKIEDKTTRRLNTNYHNLVHGFSNYFPRTNHPVLV